jgi:hypothetical protein
MNSLKSYKDKQEDFNTMKKTLLILISLLLTLPSFAISSDVEIKLLHKALLEGANSKEQKSAVAHFMAGIAAEKRKEADSFKQMASLNYGGKAISQENKKASLLKQAEVLENEAKNYESLSASLNTNSSEKIAKLQ